MRLNFQELLYFPAFTEFKVTAMGADKRRLKVNTRAPSGRETVVTVNETNQGVFLAKFTPNELGLWQISVLYNNEHCNGSPFMISVYDPSGLRTYSIPETCSLNQPVTFYIDTIKAGAGELTVDVMNNGYKLPCSLQEDGQCHFVAQFVPTSTGQHQIAVAYAGHAVPGSPFSTTCVDHRKVTITGDGLGNVPVGREATFRVICDGSSPNDIQVQMKSSSGTAIGCRRVVEGNALICNYTPFEAGTHYVNISNSGVIVEGSPFTVKAFDVSKVMVIDMPHKAKIGQPVDFDIDVSRAGIGNMEIMVNKGQVQCAVQSLGNRSFKATFVPDRVGPHYVEITFNNMAVPGSPWLVDVEDLAPPPKLDQQFPKLVQINEQLTFDMEAHPSKELKAIITDPAGLQSRGEFHRLRDNLVKLQLIPTKVGLYTVDIIYDNKPVDGSPIQFMVFNPAGIKVGPIPIGVINETVEIPVDLREAGEGEMEVQINKGTIAHRIDRVSQHSYSISFLPDSSLDHYIDIRFNGHAVPGAPFICEVFDPWKVRVDGEGINTSVAAAVAVNFTIHMPVSPSALKDGGFQVKIITPNGETVPAKVVQQGNDYRVEYVSKQVGRHTIEVFYANRPINGSPFYVDVFDPTKVRIACLDDGEVNQETSFQVLTAQAGKADLLCRVVAPSGRKIPVRQLDSQVDAVMVYTSPESGVHQIYVTYGGYEVPGSPAQQNVGDAAMPTVYGSGLYKGEEDQPCQFEVDATSMRGDLFVQVDGPNSIAKCVITPQHETGLFAVSYLPVEVGRFAVQVKWNDRQVDGSPFAPTIVNLDKVHPVNGWPSVLDARGRITLIPRQLKRIDFVTALAGPGELQAEVSSPRGKKVPVMLQKSAHEEVFSLSFTPEEEGDYELRLFYGEMPLPSNPFIMACYKPEVKIDASQVQIDGDFDVVYVNEETSFIIDGTTAGNGKPQVRLLGQRGEQVQTTVESLGQNRYRCYFVPRSAGPHTLVVTWEGQAVPGSPFPCHVQTSSDPSKVVCSGDALTFAIWGKETTALIDVRGAGPGELTAHCSGPTKPAYCQLFDHADGTFTLSVKAQEPGRHQMQIKYNGEHIPGSPFSLTVQGPPDASKVRVSGPGVEHGFLSRFKSEFVADTRGAGQGTLSVRVRGPKDAFHVEMQRDSQADRTILCRYDPMEPGDYQVHVRWAGTHVPGSPFHIQIFETKDELEDFLEEVGNGQVQQHRTSQKQLQQQPHTRGAQQRTSRYRSSDSWTQDY